MTHDPGTATHRPQLTPDPQAAAQGAWQLESSVITTTSAILPPYCLRCGTPVSGDPITLNVPEQRAASKLLGLIPAVDLALVLRAPERRLSAYLCERHQRRRRSTLRVAAYLIPAGAGLTIVGLLGALTPLAKAGFMTLVIGLVALLARSAWLTVEVTSSGLLHLVGTGPRFRTRLPEWPATEPDPRPALARSIRVRRRRFVIPDDGLENALDGARLIEERDGAAVAATRGGAAGAERRKKRR